MPFLFYSCLWEYFNLEFYLNIRKVLSEPNNAFGIK